MNNQININDNGSSKKGRGLFYFVIAFAVVVLCVVGASYAYFTASADSKNEAKVSAGSTQITLGFTQIESESHMNNNLIPADEAVAEWAYGNQNGVEEYSAEDGGDSKCQTWSVNEETNEKTCSTYYKKANSECIDDNSQEVCSSYVFEVSSDTDASQALTFTLKSEENKFANLYFMFYKLDVDDAGNTVSKTRASNPIPVPIPSSLDGSASQVEVNDLSGALMTDPDDETNNEEFRNLLHPTITKSKPARYALVLFIKENDGDQTESDSNSYFKGIILVNTDSSHGVSGEINTIGEYVSLSKSNLSLDLSSSIENTATLTAKVVNGDSDEIAWKSYDETVATVDENGLVTAVAAGTTTIKATSSNGKSATCTVTVK